MANDLTGNPLKIDTAAAGVDIARRLYVKSIRWVGATTAGHTAILKDAAGRVIWESVAAGANHVEDDLIEEWWDEIDVDTIASGKLYIYLG